MIYLKDNFLVLIQNVRLSQKTYKNLNKIEQSNLIQGNIVHKNILLI